MDLDDHADRFKFLIRVPCGQFYPRAQNVTLEDFPRHRKPEGADYLRDLLILVEESSGAITASDPEIVEVDHVVRQGTYRCGLVEGSVRAVPVVVV